MAGQSMDVTPYSIEWVGCHTHRIPERYKGGGWGWWCERARMSRSVRGQLLHHPGGIHDSPVFDQRAVVDAEVVADADVDGVAGRGDAHEVATLGSGHPRQDEDLVTFGDHVVDLHPRLIERRVEH